MESFGKLCFTVIIVILSALVGAFVFNTLWSWFIVTTFNLPQLSLPQAIGIMLFVGYLKPRPKRKKDQELTEKQLGKEFLEMVGLALFVLAFGWLVYQFI